MFSVLTNVLGTFLILKGSVSFQSASLLSVFSIYILLPPLLEIFSGNTGGKPQFSMLSVFLSLSSLCL